MISIDKVPSSISSKELANPPQQQKQQQQQQQQQQQPKQQQPKQQQFSDHEFMLKELSKLAVFSPYSPTPRLALFYKNIFFNLLTIGSTRTFPPLGVGGIWPPARKFHEHVGWGKG